jgi:RNA polymerase sigma factor (TIGR02999 family)
MGELTGLLQQGGAGDARVSDELLPVVYAELRRLAAQQMRRERAGATLQPTALVHEAYLRLLGGDGGAAKWAHAGHFYAAAGEAMRRILIERARRQKRLRHGGGRRRVPLNDELQVGLDSDPAQVLAVDEAMAKLRDMDARMHELIKLRCFLGLTLAEAGEALGVSPRTLNRDWLVATAWLRKELAAEDGHADSAMEDVT